jgi:allantoinase
VRWSAAPSVIRSHRVVLPEGVRSASIHVDHGRITRLSDFDDPGVPETDLLDLHDLVVLPGLVDSHVHINAPGRTEWEGFATATAAAAAGGVTTLLDMPLNSIPATTNVRALERKRREANGQCRVDVGFLGGVVPGNTEELVPLWNAGVLGFKCFLVPSGVDEFPNVGAVDLDRAMPRLANAGATLMVHAELPGHIEAAFAGLSGRDPSLYSTYLESRPPEAETEAVAMMIDLARRYRARVHIVHVSAAASLALIAAARAEGVTITAETCPHYLALSSEDIAPGATTFKCAPPIRDRENRDALWAGLLADTLDLVVSDHSPCPPALKRSDTGDFFAAWGGIASLELTVAVMWTEMKRRRHDIALLGRWMAQRPARLAGLEGRKGVIAAGADADLAVFDPDADFTVEARSLRQRHKLTPYDGRTLSGHVRATYLRGALIYADGALVGEPTGRLLSRGT